MSRTFCRCVSCSAVRWAGPTRAAAAGKTSVTVVGSCWALVAGALVTQVNVTVNKSATSRSRCSAPACAASEAANCALHRQGGIGLGQKGGAGKLHVPVRQHGALGVIVAFEHVDVTDGKRMTAMAKIVMASEHFDDGEGAAHGQPVGPSARLSSGPPVQGSTWIGGRRAVAGAAAVDLRLEERAGRPR